MERPREFPCLLSSIDTSVHPVGYISNVPLVKAPLQPTRCPWVIRAQGGQRVNITLYDFSTATGRQSDTGICLVYAIIREQQSQTEVTVCRGSQRVRNIYTSDTSSMEVILNTDGNNNPDGQFMLKFEGVYNGHTLDCNVS